METFTNEELSEQDLSAVIGGLDRVWQGQWSPSGREQSPQERPKRAWFRPAPETAEG